MTLLRFMRIFKKALRRHHRFDTPNLLRTWVPCEGGYSGLDPICFVYWYRTGKVSANWLRIAVKRLGLNETVAWRLRYASDKQVPRSWDEHSKKQAVLIRKKLISIIEEMRRYYRRYSDSDPAPYANVRAKKSQRFAKRRMRDNS